MPLRGGGGNPPTSDPFTAFVATIAPGNWAVANNHNVSNGVINGVWLPHSAWPGGALSTSGPGAIISAWAGMTWDSKRRRIMILNGGDSDYAGNEIYTFDTQAGASSPGGPSGAWSRNALPSDCVIASNVNDVVNKEGWQYAPIAGHGYNSPLYLKTLDRFWQAYSAGQLYKTVAPFGVCGAPVSSISAQTPLTFTGPFLANPNLFDPFTIPAINNGTRYQRCSGTACSDVNGVGGAGNMWENRNNVTSLPFLNGHYVLETGPMGPGTSFSRKPPVESGDDVIYFHPTGSGIGMQRWVLSHLGPASDQVTVVGAYNNNSLGGDMDTVNYIFFSGAAFSSAPMIGSYWDLSAGHQGPTNNPVAVTPTDNTAGAYAAYKTAGLPCDGGTQNDSWGWDSKRLRFSFWGGGPTVFHLKYPLPISASGWVLTISPTPTGSTPPTSETNMNATGVTGKWIYLPEYDVFAGIQNYQTGDVWIYKPSA